MPRLNWGLMAKEMTPEQQLAHVAAWLAAHQPSDAGYQAAARWLYRRRRAIRGQEAARPKLERAMEAIREHRRQRSG